MSNRNDLRVRAFSLVALVLALVPLSAQAALTKRTYLDRKSLRCQYYEQKEAREEAAAKRAADEWADFNRRRGVK